MELGKQIRKYRSEMKMSQEVLASEIFVTRQTISNWENDKNYPDLKSLILLSSLFQVSLDILVKGDIEEMKRIIETEDVKRFKTEGNIFAVLLILTAIMPVPLLMMLDFIGFGLWAIIGITTILYAIRIEKLKQENGISTYKEIAAFLDGEILVDDSGNLGKKLSNKRILAGVTVGAATLIFGLLVIVILR